MLTYFLKGEVMNITSFDELLTLFSAECMCIASRMQHAADAIKAMAAKANEMFSGIAATLENKNAVKRIILAMAIV